MVQMPPGSAKSTYGSVLFPPWFMGRNPNSQIIGASAGAKLAQDFAGRVLGLIGEFGPALGFNAVNESKELFYTDNGCRYISVGVGGNIAGSRGDLILIDDPVGSRADADSEIEREKCYNWYRGDLIGRAKPGCRVLLIMTRWHEDDLAGRLLMDDPGRWTVLKLPAIAEEDDQMGRAPGELLWPAYYTPEIMADKRKTSGEREWASQYQQRPAPAGGVLFEVDKIAKIPAAPVDGKVIRFWDLAATEKIGSRDPDYTVGLKLLLTKEGRLIVLDIVRVRGGPESVERAIVDTARSDGVHVRVGLPQDPGQAGKGQVAYLTRLLQGFTVIAVRPSGNKSTRAQPVSSQVNVGNMSMVIAAWNRQFTEELASFPAGAHDDQVDALSDAYSALVTTGRPARTLHLPFMGR
jgi:predicted phage terminase large subunit-like protein